MLLNTIQTFISEAVKNVYGLQIESKDIQIDHPTVEEFGDYTTNIAMKLVKMLPAEKRASPMVIGNAIAEYITRKNSRKIFSKIEAVSPGFLNITIELSDLDRLEKAKIPNNTGIRKRILVEHTGPNTNKPLHIGHVRNATLGSSMAAILRAVGEDVMAANINNDRGIHIIKSMYGYLRYGKADQNDKAFDYKTTLSEWIDHPSLWATPESKGMKPDHFVGHYYILGNNDYETSEEHAKETDDALPVNAPHLQMQEMLLAWEEGDANIRTLWERNNKWFYEGMHETLRALGIHSPNDGGKFFDKEWYESEIYKFGKEIVLSKLGNGVITEFEDGHVEAVLERYGLPNIVLLRRNKTALYITQDIEMLRQRIQDLQQDKVIYLTSNEQNLRFQQLFAICESLDIGKLDQMIHIGYGSVRLPDGKMSSRKGNVITADGLLEDVIKKAREKINEERADYTEEEKELISKQVAVAALKYGILKYNPMSNIIFDIESNVSFEGETGPYLQYTYARARSIQRKYVDKFGAVATGTYFKELNKSEQSLLRSLIVFEDYVYKSSLNFSPNYLCEYLYTLAQKFNAFYTNSNIINEENETVRIQRISLTQKTAATLKAGLDLLGIEAPEKM